MHFTHDLNWSGSLFCGKKKLKNQNYKRDIMQLFSADATMFLKSHFFCSQKVEKTTHQRDHPFKTSACLRGGRVSPCADGQKVTVHKDQKSPS